MLEETYKTSRHHTPHGLHKAGPLRITRFERPLPRHRRKARKYDEEAALSAKAGHPVMYSLEMLKSVGLGLRGICIGAMSRYFNGHTNIPNSNFIDFCVKDALTNKRQSEERLCS